MYALGFIVTREIYEDDQYGKAGAQKAKALARSMRQTKEIQVPTFITVPFAGSGYLGGVVRLCLLRITRTLLVVHSLISWQRRLTFRKRPLEQAVIDIAGFRDDRGLLIACDNLRPVGSGVPQRNALYRKGNLAEA